MTSYAAARAAPAPIVDTPYGRLRGARVAGAARWPRFDAERSDVMTIGADAGVATPTRAPRDAQLACWPAFRGGAT